MKYILNFFLIFIFTFIKSQENKTLSELEVKYNFTYVEDTLNKNSLVGEPMILLTNGKQSTYFSENYVKNLEYLKKQLDAPINKGEIRTINFENAPRNRVRHNVYTENNETFISYRMARDTYTFKNTDVLSWTIDNNEKKEILGYKCVKATLKLNAQVWIAWFTYDIPINDGPYKFKGLPGLILKLNEKHGYFNFDAISISKSSQPIEFKKGIMVSKEQFLKKREEYMNDPSQGRISTQEYRKKTEENKKKYNNSLE
ncbi:GLPGLI family protein [Chryseobacterium oryctis]|uniref:GLPGLI family protein n=1 Tax=Chryseobacterium oryctis TaxID=2952618 RepID=A0ABT3HJ05_9FLAO|nr:GLPGLI family protein [Chryseobacterium oryctis]MCW3159770.1 GLPGLI family protein [Chryseobacterium oryctis]